MTFYTAQAKGRRPKRTPKRMQSAAAGSEDDDWLPLALDDDDWCSCGDSGDEWVLMTI